MECVKAEKILNRELAVDLITSGEQGVDRRGVRLVFEGYSKCATIL